MDDECKYLIIETWPHDNDTEIVIRKVVTFDELQKRIAKTTAEEFQCRTSLKILTLPQ